MTKIYSHTFNTTGFYNYDCSVYGHASAGMVGTITVNSIPDDLKDYADLLIEWWPIRKQKGGSCTESVANRIYKTLRSFPSQDRKEALEKAITGGWKDIYPLKKGYKPEEPKNNHPASRVFTAKGGFES